MGRQLSLAIVGADYANDDKSKSNRRFEIALCAPGDAVQLIAEPDNPADRNAIAVYSERAIKIGYVTAERAPLICKLMQEHVATAIFQSSELYGAVIRAGFDEAPVLPKTARTERQEMPAPDPDSGFYPDFIPPDD